MLRSFASGLFAVSMASMAIAAPDPRAKIGSALQSKIQANFSGTYDILVYLKDTADLTPAEKLSTKEERRRFVYDTLVSKARSTQKDLVTHLDNKQVRYTRFYIANMIAVRNASIPLIDELAARPDVGRILGDPRVRLVDPVKKNVPFSEPTVGIGANIAATGAPKVWSEFGITGQNIIIGAQDTGIDWDHPALIKQYRGWDGQTADHDYNWHDAIRDGSGNSSCEDASREPCDDNGHGTHTLGTAIGDDGQGNQIGMAPGAKWIGCRNMDHGYGKPSTYIECFQFFLAPWPYGGDPMSDGKPELAADVTNNSWGCPASEGCEGDEFLPVLESLHAAGIMTVAAAGNAGSSCGTISDGPAHHTEEVFAVGAYNHRNGSIASFSSRGPSKFDNGLGPDLSAPGVSIRSSTPGGGYSGAFWSGTSMASPHVAGAVALLWSATAGLQGDIDATSKILHESAVAKTSSQSCGGRSGQEVPNNTFGHGLLNVYEAGALHVSGRPWRFNSSRYLLSLVSSEDLIKCSVVHGASQA